MDSKVVSLKTYVQLKDLEELSQVLLDKSIDLQIENQKLKAKVAHLEDLLKHSNIPSVRVLKEEKND